MEREPSREELVEHVRALNDEIAELRRARDEDAWVEESLRKRTRLLNERMKELGCLLSVVRVLRRPLTLRERARAIAGLLPPAWQHASRACARITLGSETFETPGFAETAWVMTERVTSGGKDVGSVQVAYLARLPEADEGPFLEEERTLLRAVAECLGIAHERDGR